MNTGDFHVFVPNHNFADFRIRSADGCRRVKFWEVAPHLWRIIQHSPVYWVERSMSPSGDETSTSGTKESGTGEQEVGPRSDVLPERAQQSRTGLAFFQRISAFCRRAAYRVRDLVLGFILTSRSWAINAANAVARATRAATRHGQDQIVLFPLRARSHFRRRQTLYARIGACLVVLISLFACWAGSRFWPTATRYCTRLNASTFEQVAVALGASVAGLLAIVFALTTFAIQQVAAREAAEVVLEYARDRRMASTYWILATIAGIYFSLPFVHFPQDFLPTELASFGVCVR